MRIFEEISEAESERLAEEECAAELAQLKPFLAALPRARDDGWTARRQFDFIEALADTGSVGRAADAVGMSRESAYRLRRRADARAFAEAWIAAQSIATQRLADVALERAIHGEQVPIVSGGEIVGYRVRHFEQLAMFLLRARAARAALAAAPARPAARRRRPGGVGKSQDHVTFRAARRVTFRV